MKSKKEKEAFLEIFESAGCNISVSCQKAKINRDTYYSWYDKDEWFRNKIEMLKESLLDFAESQLMKNIKVGKETSLIFFLKTKGKKRGYIERQELDLNGEMHQFVEFVIKDEN